MKKIIVLLVLLLTINTFAQKETGATLTIIIENVPNDKGKVNLGLYNEATFMKAAPIQSASGKTTERTVTLTLTDVKPGQYGVSCFHDENDNDRMDFEANGMPKESYGVSNNIMSFGPPLWSDAKFEVSGEDMEITIRM